MSSEKDDTAYTKWKVQENLKPLPKEADPDGLLDLMLELNERMTDVHSDLKKAPIEFYAKYKRLLHKEYDPCITTFNLARTSVIYRPINQSEFDELSRTIQAYWKAHFKKEDNFIIDKSAIYNLSGNMKCGHCGKTNHTAYKNGKPFCFKLIKALKGSKDDKPEDKSSTKAIRCRYCKNPGQDISDCPKLAKKRLNEETGLNHLFIGTIGVNTIETCSCIMKVYDDDSSVDSSIPPPLIQRDDSESEYEYEYDSEYDDDSTVESSVPPLIEPSEDEPAEPKASSYVSWLMYQWTLGLQCTFGPHVVLAYV